ncbi:MAG: ABC transporter permease [Clostridia bacterium]|nr:ABC transporter [Oscillospiraceae bacterium]MBQ6702611.1 ABC transporter permease [Clostridia bacterium]
MLAVYQKELKSYFGNVFGYLYISILLLFMGIFVTVNQVNSLNSDLTETFGTFGFVLILATPLLTMRIIAEERQKKTDQLLYSLPISVSSIVIAKYLAMLTVFTVPMAVISIYPYILSHFGFIDAPVTYGALLALYLLGASLLAIGMFVSALTENQIVSAILSFLVMLIIYFSDAIASNLPTEPKVSFIAITALVLILGLIVQVMVKNYIVSLSVMAVFEVVLAVLFKKNPALFEGLFAKIVSWLSVSSRWVVFRYGVFDLTSVVYFLSVIFLFVFLSVQAVEKRRWS